MWGDALPASYDNWRMSGPDEYYDEDEEPEYEQALPQFACPNPACGEDSVDYLVIPAWSEVGEDVHCESCGLWYKI